ncbi:protein D3 [Tetranychus urticae]|uniref:protein D3 n=1 Tax=Tetranychus urticae TaxID=32264 RepID=UPI00077B9AF9|nr:protein D3 [Tetranychus urticae]
MLNWHNFVLLVLLALLCSSSCTFADDNSTLTAGQSSGEITSAEEEDYTPTIECRPNVTIEDVFRENKIIDDLSLDFSEHYLALVDIEYAGDLQVSCGNELTPNQTAKEPVVFNYHSGWYEHYSVVMIDPDAPKDKGTVLHWMVVNIPGSNMTQGEVACPYFGPKPPMDHGLHRYISLIYLQSDEGPVAVKDWSQNRYNFNLTSWVQDNNLHGPLFGNFFKAQNKSK